MLRRNIMRLFRSHVLASSPVAIALVLALALAISVAPVSAQSRGSVASIHGHVQDPLQMPVTDGVIKLTQDTGVIDKGSRFLYTFNTDSNGDYKGTNITAGTYSVIVFRGDKSLDFADKITFEAGVDTKLDFDMSRAEYLSKMSAEDKKTLEEYRKKNAAIAAQNGVVKNLNALLQQARDVMNPAKTNPPDYEKAITLMTQATQAKPDEPVLWFTLGSAYVGAKKYDQAVPALQKSIDLNNSSKRLPLPPPVPHTTLWVKRSPVWARCRMLQPRMNQPPRPIPALPQRITAMRQSRSTRPVKRPEPYRMQGARGRHERGWRDTTS